MQSDEPDAFFAAYDTAKEAQLQTFLSGINTNALVSLASGLRDNIKCVLPAARPGHGDTNLSIDPKLVSNQMGGQNCQLDIAFEDGVVWIARLRLDEPTALPLAAQEKIFASEVNTLRFLAQTRVPAPKVFYHSSECNFIGTPFMIMEKLPGTPLQWSDASPQQRTIVLEQLVEVFLELERHPFPATGSLSSETGEIGPFQSLTKALRSISEHEIEMIESGELSTLALDNYLSQRWRLERVQDLVDGDAGGNFYLKHFDDKGDHILVDEQYRITGIIDWEFASAECKSIAFGSPCMLWPVGEFYEGSNQLSHEETELADLFRRRNREDMAQLVLHGRKHQRFTFFLGSPVSTEREEFGSLFQGLRTAVSGEHTDSYLDWKTDAIARALEGDAAFRRLMQSDRRAQEGRSDQKT